MHNLFLKIKRAFSLIEPKINNYLNQFNEKSLKEINFTFKKNSYKALADVIYIVNNAIIISMYITK